MDPQNKKIIRCLHNLIQACEAAIEDIQEGRHIHDSGMAITSSAGNVLYELGAYNTRIFTDRNKR